jgi:CheY-like chemotaxis protein
VWLTDWIKQRSESCLVPDTRVRILIVSMSLDDRLVLEALGRQYAWELRFTSSPRESFNLAAQSHFDLILCDRSQYGYPWREVMERLASISRRSCILLVSPVSDDYLWGNVLQHGGYDVLIRPLHEKAVLHSIDAAVRFISPADSLVHTS